MFLKFEDMKTNTHAAVTKIANFTNNSTSEDAIRRTVANSSVEKTREFWDSNQNRGITAKTLSVGSHVRKGIVGDWKTLFTVAQSQSYDVLIENDLRGSGLEMKHE
ncbi:sulfotransferase family cytosolic 1B member 1-like [Anneissia japonica]|uniref:sulfotransferase family cytosolic 1B member 1-like n=1 Tax=Anneissia japonica TaxID=1529436 RepID=UPI0014257688|nr:sulfotransferase family cytosolic 1B member 1-like [Anneissia japonica]